MRGWALDVARGALASIEASRSRIDDLNVFPVPDGDTGTNLALTVRAVVEALEKDGPDDRAGLAHEITRAALMGARGNSGVILSQAIRGAADGLANESAGVAEALRGASDAAYRAVREPVEGTMLTALRELADEAEPADSLAQIVARGDDCVARTTAMLPKLQEAGVVDAGAAGLVEIVRGIAAVLTGEPLPETPLAEAATPDAIHQELSRYRYCTVFIVEGDELDSEALEAELEPLGDSLLVVGDETALKVHVHTDEPSVAMAFGEARGALSGIEITNMQTQVVEREARLLSVVPSPGAVTDAVVVAAGAGNRRLLESLGALVVDGGRTMNPSTAEILAAIEGSTADSVIVLPNDQNTLMSAEQAAARATKPVQVVPTLSMQAGLTAMVSFDPGAELAENAAAMQETAELVATGAVTIASRDIESNGVEITKGAWLGLANGEPVAGGDSFDEVACAVLDRLLAEPRGVLTMLTGEEPPDVNGLVRHVSDRYPAVELEVHEGGQPHYALLLSAE